MGDDRSLLPVSRTIRTAVCPVSTLSLEHPAAHPSPTPTTAPRNSSLRPLGTMSPDASGLSESAPAVKASSSSDRPATIILWSHPRSCSTMVECIFLTRPDEFHVLREAMLEWNSATRDHFAKWKGWHEDAEKSTGVGRRSESTSTDAEPAKAPTKLKEDKPLSDDLLKTVEDNLDDYEYLRSFANRS